MKYKHMEFCKKLKIIGLRSHAAFENYNNCEYMGKWKMADNDDIHLTSMFFEYTKIYNEFLK